MTCDKSSADECRLTCADSANCSGDHAPDEEQRDPNPAAHAKLRHGDELITMLEELGSRVRAKRDERGLSIRRLSDLSGIPPMTISRFEKRGVRRVVLAMVKFLLADEAPEAEESQAEEPESGTDQPGTTESGTDEPITDESGMDKPDNS